MNLLTMTDSYKAGHSRLLRPGTEHVYSYLESRGGMYEETVFFGLQYYLSKYLVGQVFTLDHVFEAKEFWTAHFGRDDYFDHEAWKRLYVKHGGYLPLRIMAVPEGTVVPTGSVLMTVENTDPEFPWLTGWFETLLLKLWYPITVATQSYHIRKDIQAALDKSGGGDISFKCHDFGYRGVTSEEQAAIGGAAHLTSFMGTDTVAGIKMLADYYSGGMAGFSIPATEHSIIMSYNTELDAFEHLLDMYPTGMVACVSDTENIYKACRKLWGTELHDKVQDRDGILVVRPDSGDPNDVVPKVLHILGAAFGYSINDAGFKVLNPKVRVIQGDGMDRDSIPVLYYHVRAHGWAADNLTVGSGGGLLQKVDRDTLKMAFKASEMLINGRFRGVAKDPITDHGKKSKHGRFILINDGTHGMVTLNSIDHPRLYATNYHRDILELVFDNGSVVRTQTLEEIRNQINRNLDN